MVLLTLIFIPIRITDFGLVHGEESVLIRLELWLGNTIIHIDKVTKKF